MARRSHLITPALAAAALGMTGCLPVIQNQTSSQQDLIGSVTASAEVCDSPQNILARSARKARNGSPLASLRRAARGDLPPFIFAAQLGCADREDVIEDIEAGYGDDVAHQTLLAYRVPAGAQAPETITVPMDIAKEGDRIENAQRGFSGSYEVDIAENTPVVFRRVDSLGADTIAAADDLRPEGAPNLSGSGQKVVGYMSDVIDGIALGRYTIKATFGLPTGTADQPYAGPFNTLAMSGMRIAGDPDQIQDMFGDSSPELAEALRPDREVECLTEERFMEILEDEDELKLFQTAICPFPAVDYDDISEPLRGGDEDEIDEYTAAYTAAIKGVDLNTRDLRLLGGEGFAEQGNTAGVPFTFRGAGAASDTQLALSAITDLPGANVAPAQATTPFPGAGDHARTVNVQVPADAAPGTYAVALTAKVGGQSRTATGRVVVLPKPATAASAQARGRDNVYMDKNGNIAFGWICPPACGDNQVDVTSPKAGIAPKANTAAVSKPRLLRIARGKFKAATGKRARVKVRLFPKARKAVRNGRNVKAIIVVRAGGKGVPTVRRVTIKQRKAKR